MRPHPVSTVGRGLRADDGFTIVEVVMACMVLVVGMLGVLSLLSGSLRTTKANNERVGATNLARSLIEHTRALNYQDMAGSLVMARLQAGGELGAGSPWTYTARGVTYTITATSCTYDDPADGLASPAPAGVCLPQPAGSGADDNGDDFRRTTFRIAWSKAGVSGTTSVVQTTLVGNPAGGLGPRIVSFTPVAQTITDTRSSVWVDWTTTAAQSLRWTANDGTSSGNSSGSTLFRSTWAIGSSGSGLDSEILDGSYQISAQPFDDRGVAGEVKRADVLLNRRKPYAPQDFAGGHDTRLGIVDLQWSPNRERDILGYRVERVASPNVQVCPAPSEGDMLAPTTTSCADFSPPSLLATYRLVAFDRDVAAHLPPRDGDRATLLIPVAGASPAAPSALTVETVAGNPRLSWTAPGSGGVSFYRIYRDGTAVGYDDRYDRASGDATTYTDHSAGSGTRRYWITAVSSSFDESAPIGPVTWPPS